MDTSLSLTEIEKNYLQQHPTIKACINPAWMPFEVLTPDGKYEGIAADLLKLVAQRVGLNLEIVQVYTWEESLEKAKKKQCDILNFINKTAEYEKADKYFLSAIELSEKHKLIDQLAGAEVNRATMFFTIGEFDKAMDSYQKVLPIYLELKDTLRYAKVVMNIGLIYWNWNKNDLALEKQLEAKSLLEKQKDYVELARVYNNIGRLYYQDLKDTTKALEYYEKSL